MGLVLSVLTFASGNNRFNELFGPLFHPAPNVPPLVGPRQGLDSLHRWNVIAINASGLDHTPVAPGENRVFGEQLGPGRSSRAMAIVHIAMFDALDAVVGGFTSYTGTHAAPGPMSVDAAISQAARDTLATLFPSQAPTFNAYLAQDLAAVRNAQQKANGIDLGQRTAAAILAMRLNDGSQIPEPTRWRRLFSERSTRALAAGSNKLDSTRARRALGPMHSVCCHLDQPIPRAASARHDELGLHGCV